MIGPSNNDIKGSALLMLSLFLPLVWIFIPSSITWCFPWFDASTKGFSFSPVEYRCYELRDILPFYFSFVQVPIYVICNRMIPEMKIDLPFNRVLDLWKFHIVFVGFLSIDLFLSFSHMPYMRSLFIFTGCVAQAKWLLNR